MKERRNQIADELQDNDNDHRTHKHSRGSKKWSESTQTSDESHTQSSEKGKWLETHSHNQKEGSFQQRETSMDNKGRSEQSIIQR